MSGIGSKILCVLALTSALSNRAEPVISSQRTKILIGFLLPPGEPLSLSLTQGASLGVHQANEQPGLPVNLVVRGAAGQWGTDGVEAARMATDDEANALIASPSGAATHLALQVAGRTGVPVISLCADSSVTRTGVRWTARVAPSTLQEAGALFSHFRDPSLKKPVRDWVALVPTGRPAREVRKDLGQAAEISGISAPRTLEVDGTSATLRLISKQVFLSKVEGVLLWLSPSLAGSTAKGLREAGFSGALAGPGWLRSPDFLTAAGPAGEQCVTAVPALSHDDELRFGRFAQDYRTRFGGMPDMLAALSYDAAYLLVHLLREAGDRPAHQVFPITSDLPGVTGVLTFDSEGNRKVRLQTSKIGQDPLGWTHAKLNTTSANLTAHALTGELEQVAAP